VPERAQSWSPDDLAQQCAPAAASCAIGDSLSHVVSSGHVFAESLPFLARGPGTADCDLRHAVLAAQDTSVSARSAAVTR
jgi:hypothetical protein